MCVTTIGAHRDFAVSGSVTSRCPWTRASIPRTPHEALVQVDVRPWESQRLAAPQAGVHQQREQRGVMGVLGCAQEFGDLGGRQVRGFLGRDSGPPDDRCRVGRQRTVADG
jgi:hypothetical protein